MLRSVLVLVLCAVAVPAGPAGQVATPLEVRGRVLAAENGAALTPSTSDGGR